MCHFFPFVNYVLHTKKKASRCFKACFAARHGPVLVTFSERSLAAITFLLLFCSDNVRRPKCECGVIGEVKITFRVEQLLREQVGTLHSSL